MIRPVTFICLAVAAGSGLYVYQVKHHTLVLDRQITATLRAADAARNRAGLLRAEYALLNDPSRLGDLAGKLLPALQTTAPTQFSTWADLERRLPAIGAPPAAASAPLEAAAPAAHLPVPTAAAPAAIPASPPTHGTGSAIAAAPAATPPTPPAAPPGGAPAGARTGTAALVAQAAPHPPAHPQPAANLQAILQAALHDHQRMAAAPQPARLAAAPAHLPPAAPRPRIQPVALPVHPRPTAPAIHATEVLARADAPVSRPTQFVGSALGMARVMTPTPAVGTVPYGGNR